MEERAVHVLRGGIELNHRYIVRDVLGEGGFGITYAGIDKVLEVEVAIKEFYPQGIVTRNSLYSEELTISQSKYKQLFLKGKEKFLNEARTLAKFNKEDGIVHVLDYFEDNNTAYIVMEYLEGINLKDYINQNGILSVDEVLGLMVPLMRALDVVHSSGLIHRDISPDNIMLLPNGGVKLMDFGAARDYTEFGEKSLSVVLKHGYAPEEQYRSRGIQGPWTDVYALCATIYKCITGITPVESIQRVLEDTLPWPSQMGVVISPSVERALMTGMGVLQKNRYQNVRELCRDLYSDESDKTVALMPGTHDYDWDNYVVQQQREMDQRSISYTPPEGISEADYSDNTVAPRGPSGITIAVMVMMAVTAILLIVGIFMVITMAGNDSTVEVADSAKEASAGKAEEETEEAATEVTKEEETKTETEATTAAEPEEEVQAHLLPYTDNTFMDVGRCLTPDAYEVVVSADGEFSFGYPRYLFNSCEVDEASNYYRLSFEGGSDRMELLVYERSDPGNAQSNAGRLYDEFYQQMRRIYFPWPPKKVDDQGFSRGLIGGSMDDSGHEGVYIIAANNGVKDYILEFYYPDPDINNEYDDIDYVTDCIYRYCSFSGTTYKPRRYDQWYGNKSMGEKK